MELNASALNALPPEVARPNYDRRGCTVGIVHFGVGGFHRSHQAMYLDRLMAAGEGRDWAICGTGVLASDLPLADALMRQDGLYTLVTKPAQGPWRAQVIGSIIDYRHAARDAERLLQRLTAPGVRIMSLTITEGGYNFDEQTRQFRFDQPAVARDLAGHTPPATVFGLVTEACRRRMGHGIGGFTLLSCDNLQENGNTARAMFLAFAERRDPVAAEWMANNLTFPNSMVDRITPVTTTADRLAVSRQFGIDDGCPVVCEPFAQWVVEDRFAAGRPALEKVGVQLVGDVAPYELMKLRLLNGCHQALAYLGSLHGYRFVHEVAGDPVFAEFGLGYMAREVSDTLLPVPGVDLGGYQRGLLDRFGNPEIRDSLARICEQTSDRIPKWILPVIRRRLELGLPVLHGATIIASWARYAQGVDERGNPIAVIDRMGPEIQALAERARNEPLAFIRHRPVFGDLAEHRPFAEAYLQAARRLGSLGAKAAAEACRQAARAGD